MRERTQNHCLTLFGTDFDPGEWFSENGEGIVDRHSQGRQPIRCNFPPSEHRIPAAFASSV
jgi:hypothetical protein